MFYRRSNQDSWREVERNGSHSFVRPTEGRQQRKCFSLCHGVALTATHELFVVKACNVHKSDVFRHISPKTEGFSQKTARKLPKRKRALKQVGQLVKKHSRGDLESSLGIVWNCNTEDLSSYGEKQRQISSQREDCVTTTTKHPWGTSDFAQ